MKKLTAIVFETAIVLLGAGVAVIGIHMLQSSSDFSRPVANSLSLVDSTEQIYDANQPTIGAQSTGRETAPDFRTVTRQELETWAREIDHNYQQMRQQQRTAWIRNSVLREIDRLESELGNETSTQEWTFRFAVLQKLRSKWIAELKSLECSR